MAQLDDAARELAGSLRDSGQDNYSQTFNLLFGDKPTGEMIIVIAVKTRSRTAVSRLSEAVKAAAGPSGTPCPCCHGSGRL